MKKRINNKPVVAPNQPFDRVDHHNDHVMIGDDKNGGAAEQLADLAKFKHVSTSTKTAAGLKTVSLKAIGVSFASIFKPVSFKLKYKEVKVKSN